MKVRFWINNRMIDSPVFAENPRTYLVHIDGQLQQVPKHSATPLLEVVIKNERRLLHNEN